MLMDGQRWRAMVSGKGRGPGHVSSSAGTVAGWAIQVRVWPQPLVPVQDLFQRGLGHALPIQACHQRWRVGAAQQLMQDRLPIEAVNQCVGVHPCKIPARVEPRS